MANISPIFDKIIFLDIDGVLNSAEWIYTDEDTRNGDIDPNKLALLRQIINATGAKIVLSSAWRRLGIHKGSDFWNHLVLAGGIDIYSHVIGRTTIDGDLPRFKEIQDYIDTHDVKSFVIIDDQFDMDILSDHFVNTDWKFGLTQEDVDKAIIILNKEI